jgi:hypothetical protein
MTKGTPDVHVPRGGTGTCLSEVTRIAGGHESSWMSRNKMWLMGWLVGNRNL